MQQEKQIQNKVIVICWNIVLTVIAAAYLLEVIKGERSILYFAIFGFLISFVFGLFSHSSFVSILIKAIIFLLIFAVLAILLGLYIAVAKLAAYGW